VKFVENSSFASSIKTKHHNLLQQQEDQSIQSKQQSKEDEEGTITYPHLRVAKECVKQLPKNLTHLLSTLQFDL